MTDCLTVPPTRQATSPCICIKEDNDPCSRRLVDKNESWIADWLNLEDGLNDCFMWGFNDWLSVKRLTASPDWLMDWLTDWQTERLNDWLYVIFLDQNDHWKIDWQVERIFDCLSVCLSLSLTDWSRHYLTTQKHSNSKKSWGDILTHLLRQEINIMLISTGRCLVKFN